MNIYGCSSAPEVSQNTDGEDIKGFTEDQTATIKAAIKEWKERYVCGRSIRVQPFKGNTKVTQKSKNVTVRETVLETSGPGWIKIDPDSKFGLRDPMLHAMTHACVSDNHRMLSEPIKYKDMLIIGYQGAAIMVRLRNGTETFIRKLEEGLCDRNASFIGRYTIHDSRYFHVAQMARKHFPKGQDPMPLIRNNDVPGLVAIILDKTEITPVDIERVINLYQKAWDE
jgi:hypothetical protein